MQLQGLTLLCLFGLAAGTVVKNTAGSSKNARSRASSTGWIDELGLGAAGDLPLPESSATAPDMIRVPGEGQIEDEMAALNKPAPVRPQPFLRQPAPKPVVALVTAPKKAAQFTPHVPTHVKVLEEYDVITDDEQEQPIVRRPRLIAAAQKVVVQEKSKVIEVAVAEAPPGNEKMMTQCVAFATWVKSQGSTGPDLVRIWKGTCMPAVMSGSAPPPYSNMCNALGTAVSKFAVKPWAPMDMCQAVLQVFRESGVGATPLR